MAWYHYEPTKRIKVEGGIRAVSRRGRFGTTWWGQRWIDTLEGYDIGARLERGKSYARGGQVRSIDVVEGRVDAVVQGAYPEPYHIAVRLQVVPEGTWSDLGDALRASPYYAARLMAGDLPPEIEDIAVALDAPLFPLRTGDMETSCSCPDWSNPCKHTAAVLYLLAEEFDRDPFLLFRLRGITREALVGRVLGEAASARPASAPHTPAPVPLTADASFWRGRALPEEPWGPVHAPPVSGALPKRLGAFPFWRGETSLPEALVPLYRDAAPRSLTLFETVEG